MKSPSERLFSRKTNIPLPTSTSALKPRVISGVPENLFKSRSQKKKYHDKTARQLPELSVNQTVRLQSDKGFERQGVITGFAQTPRSYIIQSGDKQYRRNRRQLLPVSEKYEPPTPKPVVIPSIPTPYEDPKPKVTLLTILIKLKVFAFLFLVQKKASLTFLQRV